MHSIRTQITMITIMGIITSILSVFAASFSIIQSETSRNSVTMMKLIEEDTQKSLEKYFGSIEQSVEVAANIAAEDLDSVFLVECGAIRSDSEQDERTQEQKEALDSYLTEYCIRIQDFFSGVADYTQGVSGYYYCINPELSRSERGFFYKKIGKTGFIEQEDIDVEALMPKKILNATWYDAAVAAGRPVWIGPYTSTSHQDDWICSYFVPIYRSGILVGIMGMDIPCETLIAQIDDIRIYDTGYVCLLDANKHVIYHPELAIGTDLEEMGVLSNLDVLDEDSSGDKLINYTSKGVKCQISFSTLSNGMKLISIAPFSEINAPWMRLIRDILLITMVVIVLYIIVVSSLMTIITNPLKELTSASMRLANADYNVDLNYAGKNEIGTLTRAFKQMRDQIRKYINDLSYQLYHDRLTGLPNMRQFFRLAKKQKKSMLEEGLRPVTLFFDIIGLRHYNRQYGFEKGDQLLKDLAVILRNQFGAERVCRFSGDSFSAMTDEAHVEEELGMVLRECETAVDGKRLPIRVGIYPNSLEDVDINVACDRAKFAGDLHRGEISSSVTYYDASMLKKGDINRHIINNLDRALEEGWVKVYYQPIVRAAGGKICDEEALARWIDPVRGFLSPGDFIPALEDAKLIYKLDLYILERVLEKMRRQKEAGLNPVPQSINLSRMDFESCDVVEEIRRRVDEARIDRSMITVEITESVIGSDFEFMKEQVERFRLLGFPVWMDDFGSGYSSMNVLQQIHFDLIKFDMGFMKRFDEGNESRIILSELMDMAVGLGMETVCEGVEKKEQVDFLREIGCTRIQGFYYSKPRPAEEIQSLIEEGKMPKFESPEEAKHYGGK